MITIFYLQSLGIFVSLVALVIVIYGSLALGFLIFHSPITVKLNNTRNNKNRPNMAQTAGVKPMNISGRVAQERERCLGMTDAERAFRKQWLKDQILAPNEPVYVEEYWKERINPIRRVYRKPLDLIFGKLSPFLGETRAADYRYITGKLILVGFGILCTHYYFKYNDNDWTRKGGWRVLKGKPTVLPGQPGYPFKSKHTEQDYANRGFKNSPI